MEEEEYENFSQTRPILKKWDSFESLEGHGFLERGLISPSGAYLAALTSDGTLVVLSLRTEAAHYVQEAGIKSVSWSRLSSVGLDTRSYLNTSSRLILLTTANKALVLDIIEEGSDVTNERWMSANQVTEFDGSICFDRQDESPFEQQLEVVSAIHDIHSDPQCIHFFANGHTFFEVTVSGNEDPRRTSRYDLPSLETFVQFTATKQNEFFVSLTDNGVIYILRMLEDKSISCMQRIDLNMVADIRPEDYDMYGQFRSVQTSACLNRIVLCDSNNNVWVITLSESPLISSWKDGSKKHRFQAEDGEEDIVWGEEDEDVIVYARSYETKDCGDDLWKYELQKTMERVHETHYPMADREQRSCRKVQSGHEILDITFIHSENWMKSFHLMALSVDDDAVVMELKRKKQGEKHSSLSPSPSQYQMGTEDAILLLHNLATREIKAEKVETGAILALSSCDFCPNVVLTEHCVYVPTYSISQEIIVSHIILYAGVSQAERISKENRWDQFSIPLHTLEIGLHHKQTDTIAFFLKSREKAFTRFWKSYVSPLYGSPRSGSVFSDSELLVSSPKMMSPSLREKLTRLSSSEFLDPDELQRAINILIKAVHANSKGQHRFNFFQSLLSMTLDFLNGLLKDGLQVQQVLEDQSDDDLIGGILPQQNGERKHGSEMTFLLDVPESIQYILMGIVDLRGYCRNVAKEEPTVNDAVDGTMKSDGSQDDQQFSKDILIKYLLEGKIGKMLTMMLRFVDQSETDGSFQSLQTYGLHLVFETLRRRKLEDAVTMIRNLGVSVDVHLEIILLYTLDKELRNFLFEQLLTRPTLKRPSSEIVEAFYRLQQIEKSYPNTSFTKALEGKGFSWQQQPKYKCLFESEVQSSYHGDCGPIWRPNDHKVNLSSNIQYSEIMLQWVRQWNDDLCQRILLDADESYRNLRETSLNTEIIFDYLACHHRKDDLIKVIHDIAEMPSQNTTLSVTKKAIKKLKCSQYLKDLVTQELLRFGCIVESDMEEFEELITRLAQLRLLFQDQHPANSEHSQVPVDTFHMEMIQYCIKYDLKDLLYYYLDHYSVQTSEYDLIIHGISIVTVPWIAFLLRSRRAYQGPTDLLLTILGNARMLGQLKEDSLDDLLLHDRPLLAMSALLVGPLKLSECIKFENGECTSPWHVEASLLQRKLERFPKLYSAIFTSEVEQKYSNTSDISMYKLIQDNTILDVRKFFTWQSANEFASNSDELKELQHFSSPRLVEKYAVCTKLLYTYYLRQGRPNFAYLVFLKDHCQDEFISKLQIHKAKSKLYQIAIYNFTDVSVSASCVIFSEHISVCSWMLRVDVEAANFILKNWRKRDGRKQYSADQLKDVIVSLLLEKDSGSKQQLLEMIEDATEDFVLFSGLKRFSYQVISSWRIAVQFSRAHELKSSTKFMKECAREGAWLPFIVYAQMYQIAPSTILQIVDTCMRDPILKDHLEAVVRNSKEISLGIPVEEQRNTKSIKKHRQRSKQKVKPTTPQRDFRAQFYYHLGGKLPEKRDPGQTPTKKRSIEGIPSDDQQTLKAVPTIDPSVVPDNVLDILLECEEAAVPWQSLLAHSFALLQPFLSVLAACYKDSDVVRCLCVWIICEVESTVRERIFKVFFGDLMKGLTSHLALQRHIWTFQDLLTITSLLVDGTYDNAVLLCRGFRVFREGHLLIDFLSFNEVFLDGQDYDSCKSSLMRFVSKLVRQSESIWGEREATIAKSTADMMLSMIYRCHSPYYQRMLLKLYADVDLSVIFGSRDLDFTELHLIAEVVAGTDVQVDFEILTGSDKTAAQKCRESVMDELLLKRHFDRAKRLSQQVSSFGSKAILMEVKHDLEELKTLSLWQIEQARVEFWNGCDKRFHENDCRPDIAAAFFEEQGTHGDAEISNSEKAVLLSTAVKWYKKVEPAMDTTLLLQLERKIWFHKINVEIEEMQSPDVDSRRDSITSLNEDDVTNLVRTKRAMSGLGQFHMNTNLDLVQPTEIEKIDEENSEAPILNNMQEEKAFESLIGKLLDENQISQARRVAAYFGRSTKDLDIVISCIFLAQGSHSIDSLSDSIKSLLAKTQSRPLQLADRVDGSSSSLSKSASLGGSATSPSGIMVDWVLVEELQNALDKLTLRCKHGRSCCKRVLVCFKTCQILEIHYSEAVKEGPFSILRRLLSCKIEQWQIAKEYIKAFELSDEEVATFVTEILKQWISASVGNESTTSLGSLHRYDKKPTTENVTPLLQLVTQQSTLGGLLLEEAQMVEADAGLADHLLPRVSYQVEMLIRAHDCFTLAYNMEGISNVLRAARQLTSALTKSKNYEVMVRLYTGIGRFNEMSYIIDLLSNNHQFGLLLREDVEKKSQLKIALLEYIRRNYSKDMDKYEQISVAFGMHREYAEQLEEIGNQQIKILKERITGTASKDLEPALKSLSRTFLNAAVNFAKVHCLRRSQKCNKLAFLVELQVRNLGSGIRVLGLQKHEVNRLLAHYNTFYEALIVADAYDLRLPNTWVEPLYQIVIVNGDFKYLEDFVSVFQISGNVASEMVARYRGDRISSQMSANMRKFLSYVKDLKIKYRVAHDLNLQDVMTSMVEAPSGAFLRDTTFP